MHLSGGTVGPPEDTALFVVEGLGLSGKTKSLVELACGLDRYRAAVCCFDREGSPLAARLEACGIPLTVVPCRAGLNFAVIWQLASLMRRLRPAVVHCYNHRPMLYAGLAALLTGVRGTVGSLSAFACQVPDREYGFLPLPLHSSSSWKDRARNRLAGSLMRGLVAPTPTLGSRYCQYNGMDPGKTRVIPYGVDVEAPFRHTNEEVADLRRRLGAGPDTVLVGSTGRLVPQKDYPTQLKALALARTEAPELRMVLAGEGPLRPDLERLARELGVADGVSFLGYWEQVPLLLRSLDVFALASIFEPLGVGLLEAMAAGVPIVATRVNELSEILADGETGLLVPPGSPEAMAASLVRLAKNPELRRRLGEQAQQEARSRFSLRRVVEQYQELYDEVRPSAGRALVREQARFG